MAGDVLRGHVEVEAVGVGGEAALGGGREAGLAGGAQVQFAEVAALGVYLAVDETHFVGRWWVSGLFLSS